MPRGHVTEIQRARMLAAAADAVQEVGYSGMTVAQVIARARVSRRTFYDVFRDRDDCFMAAFEQAVTRARGPVESAYAAEPCWQDGVRAGLARLLALMEADRGLAKLCVVEALGAGDRLLARRAELLEELADVIDRGRREAPAPRDPPPLSAEGVVGAVFAILHTRLHEDDPAPLGGLLAQLMGIIMLPYMGTRAARRELDGVEDVHAVQGLASVPERVPDRLGGLPMRLTYRTVRVLSVIGDMPGASNREIAVLSGIADQGQISKLLGRLARLDLAENRGAGHARGGSNAWYLTDGGRQVERSTRAR